MEKRVVGAKDLIHQVTVIMVEEKTQNWAPPRSRNEEAILGSKRQIPQMKWKMLKVMWEDFGFVGRRRRTPLVSFSRTKLLPLHAGTTKVWYRVNYLQRWFMGKVVNWYIMFVFKKVYIVSFFVSFLQLTNSIKRFCGVVRWHETKSIGLT